MGANSDHLRVSNIGTTCIFNPPVTYKIFQSRRKQKLSKNRAKLRKRKLERDLCYFFPQDQFIIMGKELHLAILINLMH